MQVCEVCFETKRAAPRSKVSHKPSHTYVRIQGDIEPSAYRGPTSRASRREEDDDEDEGPMLAPAMRALVLGNQAKKAHMRDDAETDLVDIDGEGNGASMPRATGSSDEDDDSKSDNGNLEPFKVAVDETTSRSALFILQNQRRRYKIQ